MDFTMSNNWSCFSSVHIFLSHRLKAFSLNNDIIFLEKPLELVVLLQRVSKYQSVQMFWLKLRTLWSSRTSQQPEALLSEQHSTWHTAGKHRSVGCPSLCYPPKPSFFFSFTFCISHVRTYLEVCEELLHLWLEISSFWFSKDFGGVNNVSSHFSCLGKYCSVDQKCFVDYETHKSPSVSGRGGDNDCVLIDVWTISLTLVWFL